MTRDKGGEEGRDPKTGGGASRSDLEKLAAAETRVLREGETTDVDAAGDAIADSEAKTLLADEDDRTQLVSPARDVADAPTHPAMKATRVLDPGTPPGSPVETRSEPETRVLDADEDKTSPPPVSGAADRPRPPPPTPIDPSRGLEPGTVLFGEYEIVNVLGVGGMGEVYRARHRRLDEHRAIKVMHAELSKKKGASEFFYREAKALLAVRHPAVVHCHDLLSDDAGRVYLIMEMIEGIPLSKKMNDGPLSPDDVAILGARVAHGLSAAHRKGVVHRDVSPDNIVLPNGRVQEAKLIDFGIAKILQEGEGTIVDGFKGKLSYASPEQLGFFGGKMDGSSDFYSLGLVLVAAALGRPMSMGTTVMEAVDARRGFETLPDEIPVGLRSAIQPLLALDPKDRPKYVDRLFVVPGGTAGATDPGGYVRATHASPGASEKSAGGRRAGIFIAGAGAAAAAALAGTAFYLATQSATPPSPASNPPAGRIAADAEKVTPATATAAALAPSVLEAEGVPVAVVEPESPKRVEPVKPVERPITASDRIRVIGLLSNAALALEENRLMSPADDNAFDRFERVLSIDPNNRKAKDGLREVASRYLGLSDAAAARGDADQARLYLDRARKADASHPGISTAESRLEP